MRIPVKLDRALIVARIVLYLLALLPFAIGWRTPLFASWRYAALVVLLALPLVADRRRDSDLAADADAACVAL